MEVDLAAGRFSREYLRLHPIETRPQITLDSIDAATVEDLTAAIIGRADGVDLRRAMVRLLVRNVSVADWNAVDHKAVADAYAHCLHFEREPQIVGGQATSSAAPELRDFLLNWPGAKPPGSTPRTSSRAQRPSSHVPIRRWPHEAAAAACAELPVV